ncbi:MAG: hypothetical protein ACE141_06470 [Bryobacteraceae bacterium]
MNYESCTALSSTSQPGVTYSIRRMSLDRRVELTKRLRDLFQRIEFLQAGGDPKESMEAALLANQIEREYLLWGLFEVRGLEIDGQPATPESLAAAGPEELCREIVAAIKAESGLTETERKN